jgi:molybdopterin/thiamine biosynthesis adenylyltransferase/rhodanese-related sulfurtransferase
MSFDRVLEEAKKYVKELLPNEVKEFLLKGNVTLIDVREESEIVSGYIEGSILIPRSVLEQKIFNLITDYNQIIITYSQSGIRSLLAAKTLFDLGYNKVFSMYGGFNQWKKEGNSYSLNSKADLSPEQLIRYGKQILLPEVGVDGQVKLMNSKVLVIGTGGLGSACLYYLSASGVGNLGIVDDSKVDLSNLHRQILHKTKNIGKLSVDSAKETIKELNPDINVITYNTRINGENILSIIKDYDLIIDGTDNLPSKYLINDACYFLKKPYLYGGIFKFDGQVSIFDTKNNTACLRCLYSNPQRRLGNCNEGGVLGPLAGIIGNIQAMQAIKFLIGKGKILSGKLLIYDSFNISLYVFSIKKDENCELCGKKTIKTLEYNEDLICKDN